MKKGFGRKGKFVFFCVGCIGGGYMGELGVAIAPLGKVIVPP